MLDLLSGERYFWRGEWNYVRLDPQDRVAHILHVQLPAPLPPLPAEPHADANPRSAGLRSGTRTRSSTRRTSAPSSTATTTASATFAGLTQKLDYLQALGVNCLWLLPFYPSPLRDDGYDIADYANIHPSYGTLEDFDRFIEEAHRRGIRVITELVINHTSDQHPWFQAARRAPAGSPERDFYVWSDTNQKYQGARIIFTDTETSNWTWDDTAKAYYWHRFFHHQPDLNFDNPAVLDAVIEVMRFWLDRGVDGLRLDAVPYLIEREGTICENLEETHAVLKKIRAALDARYPDRMLLAEANQWPADVRPYFGDGDECHMAFHFPLMPRMFMGAPAGETAIRSPRSCGRRPTSRRTASGRCSSATTTS